MTNVVCLFLILHQEDYATLRPQGYHSIDVIVLLHSVGTSTSYVNIKQNWILEVKRHMPKIPIVLVGNKSELKNNSSHLKQLSKIKQQPITTAMGEKLACEIYAAVYVESSCVDGPEVENVFEEAMWTSICHEPTKKLGKDMLFFNIAFVGYDIVGKTSIVRRLVFGKRLSVTDHCLNIFTDHHSTLVLQINCIDFQVTTFRHLPK